MANDILVDSTDEIDGRLYVQLVVIYDETFTTSDGLTRIVPTPSSALPAIAQDKLPADLQLKLDDGEAFYHPMRLSVPADTELDELKALIRERVRSDRDEVVGSMRQRYKLSGELLDSQEDV